MGDIFKTIYSYRALVKALVVRHLAQRYRGSVLGFLWTIINPLCLMLIYALVFMFYIRFDSVDNYTVFLFCGLLPWIWAQSALIEGSSCIVSSGHLITKSLFPAQILPAISVLTNLINYIFSIPVLFLFMLCQGMAFHVTLLLLPAVFLMQALFLFGLSLAVASLNVTYRDMQHIVANILSFVFFLCPILYPRTTVPEKLRFTLDLNPFAVFTECYQALILRGELPSTLGIVSLVLWIVGSLLLGAYVFNKRSESFAESL